MFIIIFPFTELISDDSNIIIDSNYIDTNGPHVIEVEFHTFIASKIMKKRIN